MKVWVSKIKWTCKRKNQSLPCHIVVSLISVFVDCVRLIQPFCVLLEDSQKINLIALYIQIVLNYQQTAILAMSQDHAGKNWAKHHNVSYTRSPAQRHFEIFRVPNSIVILIRLFLYPLLKRNSSVVWKKSLLKITALFWRYGTLTRWFGCASKNPLIFVWSVLNS